MQNRRQILSFTVAGLQYGIDVLGVQEITGELPIARVPKAPPFVTGLINLRGHISVAIALDLLMDLKRTGPRGRMNIVCFFNGILLSFAVDAVGEVLELESTQFEDTPDTVDSGVSRFLEGVFKTSESLIGIIDVQKVGRFFEGNADELEI